MNCRGGHEGIERGYLEHELGGTHLDTFLASNSCNCSITSTHERDPAKPSPTPRIDEIIKIYKLQPDLEEKGVILYKTTSEETEGNTPFLKSLLSMGNMNKTY